METLTCGIADACAALGIGRTKLYELIAAGKLDARALDGRTVIIAESIRAYVASLPRAAIGPPNRPSPA
jgi:excisionase family DNA binding protein